MKLKITLVSIVMILISCITNKEEIAKSDSTKNDSKENENGIKKCFTFSETSAINEAEKELIKKVNKKINKELSIMLPENVTRQYKVFENDTTLNQVFFNYKLKSEGDLYFDAYVYYNVTLHENLHKVEFNSSVGRAFTSEIMITLLQDDNILIEGRDFGTESGTDFIKFNDKVLFEKEFSIN